MGQYMHAEEGKEGNHEETAVILSFEQQMKTGSNIQSTWEMLTLFIYIVLL
jgi:hypothetical protein